MTKRVTIRVSDKTFKKMRKLRKMEPDRFPTDSHLVREFLVRGLDDCLKEDKV